MNIGKRVIVKSGNPEAPAKYEGYYGVVTAIGSEFATVKHKPDFAGFQIPLADLVEYE